jgi:hypothetical protein
MEPGAAGAAPQPDTQRQPFGSPAPPAAEAAGSGTSGVQSLGMDSRREAYNMARTGASRDEVARHLKEKFGLEDPKEILDDVFLRFGR